MQREVPINAVNKNKPKGLTGLDQKVSGQAGALRTRPTQMTSHRRRGTTYPPNTITPAERGKPVRLPGAHPEGKSRDDLTVRRAEDSGASEGRPVVGRIGVATSPHPKGGRLPRGVGGREPSANRR
jgi:hypothetical protein